MGLFSGKNSMDRRPRTRGRAGELVVDRKAAEKKIRPGVGVKNCRCGVTFLTRGLGNTCPMCGR